MDLHRNLFYAYRGCQSRCRFLKQNHALVKLLNGANP